MQKNILRAAIIIGVDLIFTKATCLCSYSPSCVMNHARHYSDPCGEHRIDKTSYIHGFAKNTEYRRRCVLHKPLS